MANQHHSINWYLFRIELGLEARPLELRFSRCCVANESAA